MYLRRETNLARKNTNYYKQIDFELGAIANHCLDLYLDNTGYYDDYIPISMMSASNDFYNLHNRFVLYYFSKENGTTLKAAWEMYKQYCDEAKVPYPLSQRAFKEESKNYFKDYKERHTLNDGTRVRSYYSGFKTVKIDNLTVINQDKIMVTVQLRLSVKNLYLIENMRIVLLSMRIVMKHR